MFSSGDSLNSLMSDDTTEFSTLNPSNVSSNSTFNLSVQSDGLKCLYTNADSICNKWTELEVLVEIHQPDVIGITEAFSKNQDNNDIATFILGGYQRFCNDKFLDTKNRGTLIFIRNDIEASCCSVLNEASSKEACWCEIKVNNHEKLLVGLMYRSPNSLVENNLQLKQYD